MYHCKACDKLFLPRINKFNGEEEELCSGCLLEARQSLYYLGEEDCEDPDATLDALDMLHKHYI